MNTAVFYVDDDSDDLDLFLEVAQSLGIDALLYTEGDKMLKALLNPPPKPSVVFVDLNMPKISGYDVIQRVKEMDSLQNVPIVVLSTASDAHSMEKSKKVGARYYIKKPTTVSALKKAIEHVTNIDWLNHPKDNFIYRG